MEGKEENRSDCSLYIVSLSSYERYLFFVFCSLKLRKECNLLEMSVG